MSDDSWPPGAPELSRLHTDRQHLTRDAYGTSQHLSSRQSIYAHQQPLIDLPAWALAHLPIRENQTILDAGCGNGAYLRHLVARSGSTVRLLGFDLSRGMLANLAATWPADLRGSVHLAVADVQATPLPDHSCDAALAMHMLYHVPDLDRATKELRRVVRPGGLLLASANGPGHLAELIALLNNALDGITGGRSAILRASDARFTLENGEAVLGAAFESVERHDAFSQLVITDARPVMRYVDSLSTVRAALPEAVAWSDVLAEVQRLIEETITTRGVFHVATRAGVFICS